MSDNNAPVIHSHPSFINTRPCVVYQQWQHGVLSGDPKCYIEEEYGIASHCVQVSPGDSAKLLPMCTGHRQQFSDIGGKEFAKKYFKEGYDEMMAAAEGYREAFIRTLTVPMVRNPLSMNYA